MPSELREQRFGLLVEIVAAAPSRIPLSEEYESERASRIESGKAWPSRSQLSRVYGSWLLAVSAAMELDRPRGDTLPPSYQARPVSRQRHTPGRDRRPSLAAVTRSARGSPKATTYNGGASFATPGGSMGLASHAYLTRRRCDAFGSWIHARDAARRWADSDPQN